LKEFGYLSFFSTSGLNLYALWVWGGLSPPQGKKMTPSDQKRLKAHLKEVASILYRNTDSTELSNFESIEKSLRQKILSEVGPELGSFFFQQHQEFKQEKREQ
jgi:hypothetical protein